MLKTLSHFLSANAATIDQKTLERKALDNPK